MFAGARRRPFAAVVTLARSSIGGGGNRATRRIFQDDFLSPDRSKFDGMRLALAVPTEADARRAFDALADGGSVQMPLTRTFWSPCYGMVTDRFGLGWMVMVSEAPAN